MQIEHLRETIYCQSSGHVTDDVTSRDLKGQRRDPQNLWGTITVQIRWLVQIVRSESYGHMIDDITLRLGVLLEMNNGCKNVK